MTSSNRPLTTYIGWRPVVAAGLLLLSVFLINLVGSSETNALSSVSVDRIHADHSRIEIRATSKQTDFCHHLNRAETLKTVSSTGAHPIHGDTPQHEKTGNHEKHDCQSCCPLDNTANASAVLRSRHDGDWITALHHSEKPIRSSFVSINSPPYHVGNSSQYLVSQLTGLSGAQVAFLHTVRLLT